MLQRAIEEIGLLPITGKHVTIFLYNSFQASARQNRL
jgi:hypothetical protein